MTALFVLITNIHVTRRAHQLAVNKVHAVPTVEVTPAIRPHASIQPLGKPAIASAIHRGDQ
jgi:hypothetical protein